jgi:uncharacterized membrane protein YfcA
VGCSAPGGKDLETSVVIVIAAALFVAGGVKGIIGLGLPLTAVSIMSSVIDLRTAIAFIALPIVATNLWQAIQGGRMGEILREYWVINLCSVIGTFAGAEILYLVDPRYLTVFLGLVVVVYVTINVTRFRPRLSARAAPWVAPPTGLLSGLLTGTTGSVGIPVALFLQARGVVKDVFVRALALTFLISGSMLVVALLRKGAIGAHEATISALSLIPAFAGMWLGQRLRGHLSEERFRVCVFAFLLLAALNLIRRGLT